MAQIREANRDDQSALAELLAASKLPAVQWDGRSALFFVAEAAGRVVGMAGLETYAEAGLLRSVAIEEKHRKEGVGRLLVERAIGEAAAQALDTVYLLTTTAEAYFERFGFEAIPRDDVQGLIRRSAEFTALCPVSAVVMRLVIAER